MKLKCRGQETRGQEVSRECSEAQVKGPGDEGAGGKQGVQLSSSAGARGRGGRW